MNKIGPVSHNAPLFCSPQNKEKGELLKLFNKTIFEAAQANREKECLSTLEELKKSKVDPTKITFTPIIKMYLRMDDSISAWRILREMRKHRRKPDSVIYMEFLNWYVKKDLIDGFNYVLEKMAKDKIPFDTYIYDTVIRFYAHRGEQSLALQYFDEMKTKCEIDHFPYNDLIMMYERSNDINAAFNLYHEMKESNIEVTNVTINTLIQLLVKSNRIAEAKKLYRSQKLCVAKVKSFCIDVHNLSLGTAYIAVLLFLEDLKDKRKFQVIVGQGIHSNHSEMFEMRDSLIAKLNGTKGIKSCWVDTQNKGMFFVNF